MATHTKESSTKKPVLIICVVALVLVAVAMAVLVIVMQQQKAAPQNLYDPAYAVVGAESTQVVEEPENIPVPTEYMTFYIPEDLENILTVSTQQTEDGVRVLGQGEFSGGMLELFAILLTHEEAEGFLLGTLNHETEGSLYVTMQINEHDPADWSAEELVEIETLQERVNDFIAQLQDDGRFVPNR